MAKDSGTRFNQIIIGHLKEAKGQLALAVVSIIGFTVTSLLVPWPLKVIFDQILLGKPLPEGLAVL